MGTTITATARRATTAQAREHFLAGGEVLVSTRGELEEILVTGLTVTHTLETTGWAQLLEQVDVWRNRYPNQRFFIVERVA